jgi:hypothetical protein
MGDITARSSMLTAPPWQNNPTSAPTFFPTKVISKSRRFDCYSVMRPTGLRGARLKLLGLPADPDKGSNSSYARSVEWTHAGQPRVTLRLLAWAAGSLVLT